MGNLVSRHRPSDAVPVEPGGQGGLNEEDREGRAGQGVECCVQGACPLHPPVPQTRPLLVSALRGSVPCLHTSHLLPRPIYPAGFLGRIEPDAVPSKLHQYWLPLQSLHYCANHKTLNFSSNSENFYILN